jgi:hypothetical protein
MNIMLGFEVLQYLACILSVHYLYDLEQSVWYKHRSNNQHHHDSDIIIIRMMMMMMIVWQHAHCFDTYPTLSTIGNPGPHAVSDVPLR